MWNFSFVIPAFFILTIIIIFYNSLPHLTVRKNIAFVEMIAIEFLVIILDITSSLADNFYASIPVILTDTLNTLYFVFFFCRAYVMFLFTVSVLKLRPKTHPVLTALIRAPFFLCLLFAILSPVTDMMYYIGKDGYHTGYMYNSLYVCSFFYIALSFGAIYLKKDGLKDQREMAVLVVCNLLLLAGIILRKLLPTYLLMDTFCLMAILVVYLGFENPEFYLDLRSTAFNVDALRSYIDEYKNSRTLKFLAFIIHNYNDMREIYGATQMDDGLRMISMFLTKTYPMYRVFYYTRGRFVLICDERADTDEMCRVISERFIHPFKSESAELYFDVNYVTYTSVTNSPGSDTILDAIAIGLIKSDSMDNGVPIAITGEDISLAQEEHSLKRTFEEAIENNGVDVFLQPIVDSDTKRIVGAEALARLFDLDGNVISPGSFIPIAENSGRINELGEQVFEKTCRFISENDIEALGFKWINVNLSPLQLIRSDLSDRYADIVSHYGVDPAVIHLEITEAAVVDDRYMQQQIESLCGIGFLLVLDDYGTGYSNLSRIKKCPFYNIKIDMELVWDYCRKPDEILPTMVAAFKHMGFSITAEGIEDEAMAEAMKEIGVDYLQGYHYYKPMPMKEIIKVI